MKVTRLFPLWALLACLVAVVLPEWFLPLKPAIVPLLGMVMFGMGTSLTANSFMTVMQRPFPVVLGVTLQFLMMPLLAWLLVRMLDLSLQPAVGLVLVGCCPGGTASNVICYLARGDVALSITLTAASTLLAVVATPLLTLLYAGQTVPVPVFDMLSSIFRIIFLPVALGVLANRYFHARLLAVRTVFPVISMLAIVTIIAIIVALNRDQLRFAAGGVAVAVIAHNLLGLLAGYWVPRWLSCKERECRTLAIEVGMQNSGLAVALAVKYFSAAAALPGALFSIWHNLSGSYLAGYWNRRGQCGD
ncbi:MAG: bile acid:sodium symporter family protein [Gammaproteobacteria bacterium]